MTRNGKDDEAVEQVLAQLLDADLPEMCPDLTACKAGGCVKRAAQRAAEAVS